MSACSDESPLERKVLLSVLWQVLAAVKQVHGAKWLHRDIKPANFLYFDDGIIKLADFGCAAQIGSQSLARWKCAPFPSSTRAMQLIHYLLRVLTPSQLRP